MFTFDIVLKDGSVERVNAYTIYDNYYPTLNNYIISSRKQKYNSLILTFDIETTLISNVNTPYTFMYQWQMGVGDIVFFGRTWVEWLILLRNLYKIYRIADEKFVCYVHNLSYEYQFIRDFVQPTSTFAIKAHKVLKCVTEFIEFRCSYMLSNMSLEAWTANLPIRYLKRKDKFNYDLIRTPSTPLTTDEMAYCYLDVRALYECIVYTLQDEGDTLLTIPLTSTGYVRRHCYSYLAKNPQNWIDFTKCRLTKDTYDTCKMAFRGGNTSANRYYVNQIVDNVGSYDKKSSYPYQLYSKSYPQGIFMMCKSPPLDEITHERAWLLSVKFTNLDLHLDVPIPYLSMHKCALSDDRLIVNGRVISATELTTICTEIDLSIILQQYDYDNISFGICYMVKKRKLPDEFIESMLDSFDKKCELQCDDNDPNYYYYVKAKNRTNSYYGMFVSDIVHADIIDKSKDKILLNDKLSQSWRVDISNIDTQILHHYTSRGQYLHYAKGIWCTAYARLELQEVIDITGDLTLYCDTDSDKFKLGYNDAYIAEQIERINERVRADSYTKVIDDKQYTLGVWEREKDVKRFKTLGAKKYYCEYNDRNVITVSGLNKQTSLDAIDSIDKFTVGTKIPPDKSGRTSVYYNDEGIHYIYINGERILTASNVAIVHTDYTLNISDTLIDFLNMIGD